MDDALDPQQQALLESAKRKKLTGQKLDRREEAALRRALKADEERRRRMHYRSVPKKHYVEMSGRQHKVLAEQAGRYGIPLFGELVNLYEVIRWVHDFLAEHGPQLLKVEGEEAMLIGGESTPALEKLREESFRLKRLDRLERQKELLPRAALHDGLTRIASRLRRAGETLQKRYDPEAQDILNEALDDVEREIATLFSGEQTDDLYDDPTPEEPAVAGNGEGATPADKPAKAGKKKQPKT